MCRSVLEGLVQRTEKQVPRRFDRQMALSLQTVFCWMHPEFPEVKVDRGLPLFVFFLRASKIKSL